MDLELAAQARKLGHLSGAEPGLCLLKMVQAAVVSEAAEVRLTTTRNAIFAEFEMPSPLRLENILEEEAVRSPAEAYVRSALLTAVGISPGVVTLNCGASSWSTGTRRVGLPSALCRLTLAVEGESWWRQFLSSSQHAQLYRLITERCALCTIPVKLDRRGINRARPEKLQALAVPHDSAYYLLAEHLWLTEQASPSFALASLASRPDTASWSSNFNFAPTSLGLSPSATLHREVSGLEAKGRTLTELKRADFSEGTPDGWDWEPYLNFGKDRNLLTCLRRLRENGSNFGLRFEVVEDIPEFLLPVLLERAAGIGPLPSLRMSRWLALTARNDGTNLLLYCEHGVLLNPIPFAGSVGGIRSILASAPKTDLSGLEVIRSEQVERDVAWALAEGQTLLETVRPLLAVVQPDPEMHTSWETGMEWRKAIQRLDAG